jgi:alpha-ribazole phosphatase
MTVWHWVRHGPTHEKTFVGWRDVPADLSDKARIARLADWLPRPALLISSDLIRATATANAIASGRTRLPDDPDLREFNFGDWDGKTFDEVANAHPDLARAYWETPGDITPPGGESWNAAARRVSGVVDALSARHHDRDIVAVAHIGVIMTQIQRAERAAPEQVIGHRIDNLSVTRLLHDGCRWSVGEINRLP